jgi:serine/threonine protein kinase
MVLLAEYRGTKVAIKRVLPPKRKAAKANDECEFSDEEAGDYTQSTSDMEGSMSQVGYLGGLWCGLFASSEAADYKRMEKDFVKEMRLLSKLRHPCIAKIMGAVLNTEPMLVMEAMYCGSLYDLLHNGSMVLDGEILLPILRDIVCGLRFLHAAAPQIVHSDLKAGNVLVDGQFHAKVADFGLSGKKRFRDAKAVGTPFWMAPELLRGETMNTPASDIYAFGIILFEVLSRKDPYHGEKALEVLALVVDKKVNKRPGIPTGCSPESAELIRACTRAYASSRLSAEEISVRLDNLDAETMTVAVQDRRRGSKDKIEQTRAELFPQHIAKALRKGRKVKPEPHDCVTVYFSDIVNYTTISSGLSATKVSSLLDRLYTKFDDICEVHNVFKVETVGDTYMTVTNLEKSQPDHCEIMALFALDCLEAAATTLIDEEDPSKGYVEIRSGFNSGPVVAHVVGKRNPRYSIIGDTVNTAARMESNSKVGRIQCSEESANMLLLGVSIDITVKRRGEVHIKGKGDMMLYWVTNIMEEEDEEDLSEQFRVSKPSLNQISESLDPIIETSSPDLRFSGGVGNIMKRSKRWLSSQALWVKSAEQPP